MSLFKTVTMQVQGVTSGIDADGLPTDTVGVASTFKGTFQPARGQDLQALPEGRRANGVFKVYSDLDFDTVTSDDNPDQIVLNSRTYEIVMRAPWQNSIIPHYKYLVQEIKSK